MRELTHFRDLNVRERAVRVVFSSVHGAASNAAAFATHVVHVGLVGSSEQVFRLHASPVVAAMENEQPSGISVSRQEHRAMSRHPLPKEWNPAIAGLLVRLVDALQAVADLGGENIDQELNKQGVCM